MWFRRRKRNVIDVLHKRGKRNARLFRLRRFKTADEIIEEATKRGKQ